MSVTSYTKHQPKDFNIVPFNLYLCEAGISILDEGSGI